MSSDSDSSPPAQPRVLDFWREGDVWFRELIPRDRPWGDDSFLEEVPESARGHYGVKAGEYVKVDGQSYEPGQYVIVDSREELRSLVAGMGQIEGVVFPWYDRLVPPSLWLPHLRTIELREYRAGIAPDLRKSFFITAGLLGAGFFFPAFRFLALLAAVIYGLFPLVQNSMAWLRRVDRFSIRELNERMVNGELFRRWILGRSTWELKLALGLLILVYVGQAVVDRHLLPVSLTPSIEAAALVKAAVLEKGEWWRTITTGLMHGNIIHIFFNGMALYSLGRVVVALVKWWLLAFVFLFTVVTGSLASLYLGSGPVSVGASGGILGVLGFLLVVTHKFRGMLPNYLQASLIQSTIVVSIFGFLGATFIDNAAHAGGFLGGIVIGGLWYRWLRLGAERARIGTRVIGAASLFLLLAAAVKVAIELYGTAG